MKFKLLFLIAIQFIVVNNKLIAHSSSEALIKFTQNKKQLPKQVQFHSKLNFGEFFIEKNTNTLLFYDTKIGNGIHHNEHYQSLKNKTLNFHAIKVEFLNANSLSKTEASVQLPVYTNYFLGNDTSKWATNVPSFKTVTTKNIYNGIDVLYYGDNKNLKYDYLIHANADAKNLKIKYTGADKLEIKNNELLIYTSVGLIKEILPEVYQIIDKVKVKVECNYVLQENIVSFAFPKGYNKNKLLVIDPSLVFSSFTGSTADNWGFTATYDDLGNAYAGGICFFSGYPITVGAFQSVFNGGVPIPGAPTGFDMAISKFSSNGNSLLYSTYLGGAGNEQPHSLVVNDKNELFVFGRTNSFDYPITLGAYDETYNGNYDIVITKFNSLGTSIRASTYVGGSGAEGVNYSDIETVIGELKYNYADDARGEIILDSISNVYIASCTNSSDFPITSNSFQPTKAAMQDGCVFKLDSNLTTLIFSSFLGGSGRDAAYSLSLSKTNKIIVTGGTQSVDLTTTLGVLHSLYQGGKADGFVYVISNDATNIDAASYIGTLAYDQVYFVQTDKDNDVYLFGQTEGQYSITNANYSNPNSGQFIHKLNIDLTQTIYSTVFGTGQGKPDISPTAFLVDRCENVYCAGWGGSLYGYNNSWSTTIGLPTTNDAFQKTTNSDDIYFFILRKNADTLAYATFFGGVNSKEHVDGGTCRFDKNGIIYQAVCGGCGALSDMPTSPGVVSNTNNSFNCNYGMIKYKIDLTATTANFGFNADTLGCSPFSVKFTNNSTEYTSLLWDFDDGTTSQDVAPQHIFQQPGVYNVKLITYNPNTCNERDTAIKKIYVQAPFAVIPLGNKTLCMQDSIELDATYSNALSYRWNPQNLVTPIDTLAKVKVAPTATTTFSVLINDGICTVTNIATITVTQNKTKIIPSGKILICTDSVTELRTEKNYITYLWTPSFATSKTITANKKGYYKVNTIDENMCKGTDSVAVDVQDKVQVTAFLDTTICQHQAIKLYAQGADSYTWKPSNYLSDTLKPITICTPGSTIQYIITGKINNCAGYDTVKITVIPNPKIELGDDIFTREGEEINLLAKADSLISWIPNAKLNCNACLSPKFIADTTTQFYATAANIYGCKTKDSVMVFVDTYSSIYFPNSFTPNNDLINDVYKIVTYGISSYSVKIYNRWGSLIYQWIETENGWDGTYKGYPAKQDVYIYSFEGRDVKNKKITINGNITLIR